MPKRIGGSYLTELRFHKRNLFLQIYVLNLLLDHSKGGYLTKNQAVCPKRIFLDLAIIQNDHTSLKISIFKITHLTIMKQYLILLVLLSSFLTVTGVTAQNDACACCTEAHKAFDFWIGDWEVFLKDGSVAGRNQVVKLQDSCVLQENWTSTQGGFTGTSYNFFNQQTGKWEQLWIDNAGSQLKLYGNRVANQMVLDSEPFERPDGKTYVNRITWTANTDGTVRQVWELLHKGEVVQVAFDGLYKPAQ